MTFVTIGSAAQGFERLTNAVAALTVSGEIPSLPLVIQAPRLAKPMERCEHRVTFPPGEFARLMQSADYVICHAGAGTLLHAARTRRLPIIVPRLKKFGEAVDDHQAELATMLRRARFGIVVDDVDRLPAAFGLARRTPLAVSRRCGGTLVDAVSSALTELIR